MPELTVTKTKDYLVLKIPLKAVRRGGKVTISPRVERAVAAGLKAYRRGRTAGPFDSKAAVSFLRTP